MFSFLREGGRILPRPRGPGRIGVLLSLSCFLASLTSAQPDSVSIEPDIHRSAHSLCSTLPEVWSQMRSEAFRKLLAPRDIRIELPGSEPASMTSGIYSPEQAFFIVRDFLSARELSFVALGDTQAAWIVRSSDGRIACECPSPRESGTQAHGIVHLSAREAHGREPLRRRLYVGLRRVAGAWHIAEIRELP